MKEKILQVQAEHQELLHFATTQLILSSNQAKMQQGEIEGLCQRQTLQLVSI